MGYDSNIIDRDFNDSLQGMPRYGHITSDVRINMGLMTDGLDLQIMHLKLDCDNLEMALKEYSFFKSPRYIEGSFFSTLKQYISNKKKLAKLEIYRFRNKDIICDEQ